MSLLCRLKKLVHKGILKAEDLDRIVIIPKGQISDLKEAYNKGYDDGREAIAFHLELCKEEGSIITVPEGATNGDMIKAMFPNIQWDNGFDGIFNGYKTNDRMMAILGIDFNWWNSPYRKEQG